jgi:hypothetical protein
MACKGSSRGIEKTWVYGGLRVADGQAVTLTAPSRNSANYQRFLHWSSGPSPDGEIAVVTDKPVQPYQRRHARVAGRASTDPTGVYRQGRVLAEPPRGLVAPIPPAGAGWAGLCRHRWRPGPRPGSSTSAPGRGCGAGHNHHRATGGGSLHTGLEEPSISPTAAVARAPRLGSLARLRGSWEDPTKATMRVRPR